MTPESIVVIFLALAAGSLVKGISGLGLPLVAIPVMAGFLGAERAVVMMVVPGIIINFALMWTYRAHATALPHLPLFAVVSIIGVAIGAWILSAVPERYIFIFMALWLGVYLVKTLMLKSEFRLPPTAHRNFAAAVLLVAGLIQGATGSSGPVVATYVHALRLPQPAFVFTISVYFQVFMFTQVAAFSWLGMLTADRFLDGLVACIPVAIFLPLAVYISRFINQRWFNLIIIAVLMVIEVRLLFKALA